MKSLVKFSLICLLVCAAVSVVPALAGGASLPDDRGLRIFGRSALTFGGKKNSVHVVDLRNGRSAGFRTLGNIDRRSALLENGVLAAVALGRGHFSLNDTDQNKLFASGAGGAKLLASWSDSADRCNEEWRPLAVDKQRRVTALHITLKPATGAGGCVVDVKRTKLVRFSARGTKKTLYVPNRYKRWLVGNQSTYLEPIFALRGGLLPLLKTQPHNRIALLNLRARRARQFNPGEAKVIGVSFAGSRSLLVTMRSIGQTTVKRFSTSGRAERTIYEGPSATVSACGKFTSIARSNSLAILDDRGRTVYSRNAPKPYYSQMYADCSGAYLYYLFEDGCIHCSTRGRPQSGLVKLANLHFSALSRRG